MTQYLGSTIRTVWKHMVRIFRTKNTLYSEELYLGGFWYEDYVGEDYLGNRCD